MYMKKKMRCYGTFSEPFMWFWDMRGLYKDGTQANSSLMQQEIRSLRNFISLESSKNFKLGQNVIVVLGRVYRWN